MDKEKLEKNRIKSLAYYNKHSKRLDAYKKAYNMRPEVYAKRNAYGKRTYRIKKIIQFLKE